MLTLRGRSREIGSVLAVLRHAQRESRGIVVVISGEAGIGKTAVLRTAMEQAGRMGFTAGYGRAEPVDQIAPGGPLLMALRSGSTPLLDGTTFNGLAPSQTQPPWLIDEIGSAIDKVAHQGPVLIAVDDMQWSDQLTRFAIRVLPGRLADAPIVWMLSTRRPIMGLLADLEQPRAEGLSVEVIELGPLAEDDLDALARDVMGAPAEGILQRRLHDLGGNPSLAVHLVEDVQSDAEGCDTDEIPQSLVTFIRSRLEDLSVLAGELLRLISVWERPLSIYDAVSLLSTTPPIYAVLAVVEDIVATGMIDENDDLVAFRHELVRQAVYADIQPATRRSLHRRCTRHLLASGAGAAVAAFHARVALTPGDEESIGVLRQAAADIRDSRPQQASELMGEAYHALAANHPRRLEVGEQRADLLADTQYVREALTLVDELLTEDLEPDTEARLQVIAARALWSMGTPEDTPRRVSNALARSDVSQPLRARLTAARVLADTRVEDTSAACTAAQAALAGAEAVGDVATKHFALHALAAIATGEVRHQIAYDHFHHLRRSAGPAFLAQEIAELELLDRFDEAQALIETAERCAESTAEPILPSLLGAKMWQGFLLGRYDQATAHAHNLIRLSAERGLHGLEIDAWQLLSFCVMLAGDLPSARRLLDNLQPIDAADSRRARVRLIEGYLTACEGDPVAAVTILKPLINEGDVRNVGPRPQEWTLLQVKIALAAGDREFATMAVSRAECAAGCNPGAAGYEGVALHVRGLLGGDAALLSEAVRVLRGCPRPQLLGYALADHGGAMIAGGHRDRAIGSLDEAWMTFDRLGHLRHRADVQRRLDELGVHRRHRLTRSPERPAAGLDALTTTERLVADLISDGLTNRAAATQLGVSVNTVGTHLRSVFAKLEVRTRVQLANAWNGQRDGH